MWPTSVGGTAGPSGGGVGRFLADMVRVEEGVNLSFAVKSQTRAAD